MRLKAKVTYAIIINFAIFSIICHLPFIKNNSIIFYTTILLYSFSLFFIINKLLISKVNNIISLLKDKYKNFSSMKNDELDIIIDEINQFEYELEEIKKTATEHINFETTRLLDENLALKKLLSEQSLLKTSTDIKPADGWNYYGKYDDSTSLLNPVFFNEMLNKTLSHAERYNNIFAILLVNIDEFYKINKQFNEKQSYQFLSQIGERFKNILRQEDVIAKLDHDEFIILLSDLNQSKLAGVVADKLIDSCRHPITINNKEIKFSITIGIVVSPADGNALEELLKNVNTALFRAKKKAKGSYLFYTEAFNQQAYEHGALKKALQNAIQSNELELHYQPKFEIKSGNIIGVEALMRWNHPDLGEVSPIKFLTVAEESGLIAPITEWAINEGCRVIKYWQDLGYQHLTVSIKLSFKQCTLRYIHDYIKNAIQRNDIHPKYLELEITEQALMSEHEMLENLLNEMKRIGILVSIDHFGKGMTSIPYLKSYPFSAIKIDRSYIRGIPNQANDMAITAAIIALAHQLGLTVIAEGVETADQVEFLTEKECDILQGYFLGKPVSHQKIQLQLTKLKDEVLV